MPVLDTDEIAIAQGRIDSVESGTYTLKKMFGSQWDSIPIPTNYGARFKQTVENGSLHCIALSSKKSDNHWTYVVRKTNNSD